MKDKKQKANNNFEAKIDYRAIFDDTLESIINEPVLDRIRKTNRVAIYVRVSTEEQKRDGFSIRAQIEKLTQYAGIKDWVIVDIYDDKGISGKNVDERPDLKRMIEDIKNDKIDIVLVFKLDRLTRSIRDLMELTDIFNDYKCEFCSLTENIDTHTASGRMFLKILGIFAEFERENLIERVRGGFERKAKEGYSNSKNIISYGYTRNKGEKILTINEEEAKVIQHIFKSFVEDFKTEDKIAKALNAMQIKSKLGHHWCYNKVKQTLTNPTYIGKIRYAMDDKDRCDIFDGKHEAIISNELFEKAQNRINNRTKIIKTKRPKEDAYYTGLVVCSECGGKMTGHRNYKTLENGIQVSYIQYICSKSKYKVCKQGSVNQNKLETAFIEYINNIEELTETKEINSEKSDIKRENKEQSRERLNQAFAKMETKKRKIMELYINETIDFKEYREMTAMIEISTAMIENNIAELEEVQEEEEIKITTEDIIASVKENWLLFDNTQKMDFLQTFVEQIEVESIKDNGHFNKVKIKKIIFNKK